MTVFHPPIPQPSTLDLNNELPATDLKCLTRFVCLEGGQMECWHEYTKAGETIYKVRLEWDVQQTGLLRELLIRGWE